MSNRQNGKKHGKTPEESYYDILGVSRTASQEEIKKAFRKKISHYHPDNNKDLSKDEHKKMEDTAASINVANSVLSDPEKRKLYDMGGQDAVNQRTANDGTMASRRNRHEEDGISMEDRNDYVIFHGHKNLQLPIEVSLKKLYTGGVIKHEFTRSSFCSKCEGNKTLEKNPKQCSTCRGEGIVKIRHPIFGMSMAECDKCNKSGLDSSVKKCKDCRGIGIIEEKKSLEVTIPRGAHEGYPILIDNEGNVIPNKDDVITYKQERTNVVFVIKEKQHETFKRNNDIMIDNDSDPKHQMTNLLINLDISFVESIIGFEKSIKHLDGTTFIIRVEKPINNKTVLSVVNRGMPYIDEPTKFGNLFVKVNVSNLNIKKSLTSGEKQKICQLLNVEYVPLTSTKACEYSIVENKFQGNNRVNNDDEGGIPDMLKHMMGGQQRNGGQQKVFFSQQGNVPECSQS